MFSFRKSSIQHKLTLIITLTSLAVLTLAGVVLGVYLNNLARNELKQRLTTQARFLGSSSIAVLISKEDSEFKTLAVKQLMDALEVDRQILAARLYDAQGHPVGLPYVRRDIAPFSFPETPKPGSLWIDAMGMSVAEPVEYHNELIGTVYLKSEARRVPAEVWLVILIILAGLTGVVALVAHRVQRLVSRPILNLARVANEVAATQNYALRAVRENEDDLGHLAGSFNWMLTLIQAREAELQKAREELEQRVAARTAELSQANQMLVQENQERRRAEEALRNSQQKLLLHVQQTPLGVVDWNLDFQAINWNPAAERLFGYSEAEAIGRHACDLIFAPKDRLSAERNWQDLRAGSGGKHVVMENRTKEGRSIRCEWFNTPLITLDGRVVGVSSLILDITERLNLEEQLRQSQKMEAIGRLAAGVAHDFNNVLTIIQGHTALVLKKLENEPAIQESLKQVGHAAQRAANLVRQLLAFSRRQVIQPKTMDLNETVQNMARMLSRMLGEDIVLEFDCAAALPPILADEGMIEQVILNLVINARDAMPLGGRVVVGTRLAAIEADYVRQHPESRTGSFVCLSVSDTGTGIEPAIAQRIFEPFFTTKEVGKGTGLGLSMVYGIVKQHEGWVELVSAPGKGSVFRIYLPYEPAQHEAASLDAVESSEEIPGGSETILVVEDEQALRELVRDVLEFKGYQILIAGNGVEALRVWDERQGRVDLLVTDMVMPEGISGRMLAARLREQKPQLKVIYTSGYSVELVNKDFLLQEGVNFLAKPFHPEKLARVVRDCLDNKNNPPVLDGSGPAQ